MTPKPGNEQESAPACDLQPSMPPFPVARKRPDQFSGNQASKTMLEELEVLIVSAMRQRSADTVWLARLHVASLSGKAIVVPAATNWRTFSVALSMWFAGWKARHFL